MRRLQVFRPPEGGRKGRQELQQEEEPLLLISAGFHPAKILAAFLLFLPAVLPAQVRRVPTGPVQGPVEAVPLTSLPSLESLGGSLGDLPAQGGLFEAFPALRALSEQGGEQPEDPYEAVNLRAAGRHGTDVEAIRDAVVKMDRAAGFRVRALLTPAQMERELAKDSFKTRFLEPVLYGRSSPGFQDLSEIVLEAAREYSLTPVQVEEAVRRNRLEVVMASKSRFRKYLFDALEREEMQALGASWPENRQAEFLRGLMQDIRVKSGKSVEEVARAGAFAYVRFSGAGVTEARSGRDPDHKYCDAIFYVLYEHGRFKVSLYGTRRPVSSPEEGFKAWLLRGVPDLRLGP